MYNLSYFLSLLQKDNYVNIKMVPSVKKSKFSSQQFFVIMLIIKGGKYEQKIKKRFKKR